MTKTHSTFKKLIDKVAQPYEMTLIDVGAEGGIRQKWQPIKDQINIIAFEPDKNAFNKIAADGTSRTKYFNNIIYKHSQDLTLYVTKDGGHASIYKPNWELLSQFPDGDRYKTVEELHFPKEQVKSLDDVFAENNIADVDFLDLSSGGCELSVLQGAKQIVLPKLFAVQTKMYLLEKFHNQEFFHDIDRYCHDQGFGLMDIRRIYWKRKDYTDFVGKGQLERCDGLYFKRLDVFRRECESADQEYATAKVLKAIVICLIFKKYDYATSLATLAEELSIIDGKEHDAILKDIKQCAHEGTLPNFVGKSFLHKAFRRISESLQPPSYLGWADGDRDIANIRDY